MIPSRLSWASISLLAATYLTWCADRFSPTTLARDQSFPRAWPYPDRILLALHDYYDKMYPAPEGSFKIHGEITRVLATFSAPAIILLATSIALATPEVCRVFWSFIRHHGLLGKQAVSRESQDRPSNNLWAIRFGLRTLLIVLAVGPPILAWLFYIWLQAAAFVGLIMLPPMLMVWAVLLCLALLLQRLRY